MLKRRRLVHHCIEFEKKMRYILFAILLSIATPAFAQYLDTPMWDRNYDNPEYRRYRAPVPQQRGPSRGPQVDPCIYHGDCMGPKYQDRVPMGPPRLPP